MGERSTFLPIGTLVKPWGHVGAVLLTQGERYYMLIDEHGAVALLPASVVDARYYDSVGGSKLSERDAAAEAPHG